MDPGSEVSIPFKRESVSQDLIYDGPEISRVFQFPSNGKAYPKAKATAEAKTLRERTGFNSLQTGKRIPRDGNEDGNDGSGVSIPFKRESVSQGHRNRTPVTTLQGFQFPSNGKAYPKIYIHSHLMMLRGFNSLQTGKRIPSHEKFAHYMCNEHSFNSLQTGKRIPRYT